MEITKCPECGCPINGEKVCPECGYPLPNNNAVEPIVGNDEFNETKPYSPFSSSAWIFKTPYPLSEYPRGAFAEEQPILGWLFGPIHIASNNNVKDKEYYDVINNIFLLWNLSAKFVFYSFLWLFAKTWWIILTEILLLTACFSNSGLEILGFVVMVTFLFISIPFAYSAWCASFHRYSPIIIKTYRRIRKRHWNSIYKAVKNNNLNLD